MTKTFNCCCCNKQWCEKDIEVNFEYSKDRSDFECLDHKECKGRIMESVVIFDLTEFQDLDNPKRKPKSELEKRIWDDQYNLDLDYYTTDCTEYGNEVVPYVDLEKGDKYTPLKCDTQCYLNSEGELIWKKIDK